MRILDRLGHHLRLHLLERSILIVRAAVLNGHTLFQELSLGATIDDIDMDAVAEYAKLVGYGKSPLEYLRENNGFVTTNKKAAIKREQSDARISSAEREQARPQVKGEEDVSVACILLFGKNPQKFFPRSRTRFIRYEGVDEKVGAEMNVIKDVIFEGTILNQVRKTIEDGLEFLEKILGVMRQIENLQERCADIQKAQEVIQKRLDGYKDMKVGLSPTDKAVLTKLPELIYQQVNQNVSEAADNVKVAITKHAESTLKSVDEACDMRIKKAKKELGADKGIFLS